MAYTVDGLSIDEIAELTDQPAATVRSNLRHARTKLKAMVIPRPEGGGDERRRVPGP
jgi:DNA-directed RNA polymerase specialized sigma24 family protein